MSIGGVEDFVRRGIAAQNAADRAAGQLTASEHDQDTIVTELRARLELQLAAAIESVRAAAETLAELKSDALYDVDYAEGTVGDDLEYFIHGARRNLTAAHAQVLR